MLKATVFPQLPVPQLAVTVTTSPEIADVTLLFAVCEAEMQVELDVGQFARLPVSAAYIVCAISVRRVIPEVDIWLAVEMLAVVSQVYVVDPTVIVAPAVGTKPTLAVIVPEAAIAGGTYWTKATCVPSRESTTLLEMAALAPPSDPVL
jgi:hypothetical protein